MAISETTIAVALDTDFGHQLNELAARVPVWVRKSAANLPLIQALWTQSEGASEKADVTSFSNSDVAPEPALLENWSTIDLHHPEWLVLEVYGLSRTPAITALLIAYGVETFQDSFDGFVASRAGHFCD